MPLAVPRQYGKSPNLAPMRTGTNPDWSDPQYGGTGMDPDWEDPQYTTNAPRPAKRTSKVAKQVNKRAAKKPQIGKSVSGKPLTDLWQIRTPQPVSSGGGINLSSLIKNAIEKFGPRVAENMSNAMGGFEYSPFSGSLLDYMNQAQGLVPGIGDGGFGSRRTNAISQTDEVNAKVQAMFNQLMKSQQDYIPEMESRSTALLDDTDARTAASQERMMDARATNRAAEQESLDRSGLSDSKLLSEGRQLADADSEAAIGRLNEKGAAQRDFLGTVGAGNIAAAEAAARGAGSRGTSLAADNLRGLNTYLADMDAEEAQWRQQAEQQRQSQIMQLAQAMYSGDYAQYQDDRNFRWGMDDRAYNRALGEQQMMGDAANSQFDRDWQINQYQNDLAQQQIENQIKMANQYSPAQSMNAQTNFLKMLMEQGRMSYDDAMDEMDRLRQLGYM